MTSGDYALIVFGVLGAVMAGVFGCGWWRRRRLRKAINDSPLNLDRKNRMLRLL